MGLTEVVRRILANYQSDNPGDQGKLAQILLQGRLGGTGKMIVLPVDQGIEHWPARSFAVNPPGYDPVYHHQLAIDAGLSAYAAPLGALEVSSPLFPGQISHHSQDQSCQRKRPTNQAPADCEWRDAGDGSDAAGGSRGGFSRARRRVRGTDARPRGARPR